MKAPNELKSDYMIKLSSVFFVVVTYLLPLYSHPLQNNQHSPLRFNEEKHCQEISYPSNILCFETV